MKKMLVMMALVLAAFAANAASFAWSASNIYASDGVTKYSGVATLYCVELDGWSKDFTITSGAITKAASTFESDSFVTGNDYNFYFTITDANGTFTSAQKLGQAQASATPTITFGSMATPTKNPDNWKGGDVPEPTSGLLLLIGGAMLALRRKQK